MHWIALQPLPEPAGLEEGSGPAAQDTQAASADGASPVLADALTALGWWALQFTPKVAQIDGEAGQGVLVMEVSASERLFGGRKQLLRRIYQSNKPVALVKYAQAATSLIAIAKLQVESPAAAASRLSTNAHANIRRPPASQRDGLHGQQSDHLPPSLPDSPPDILPIATLAAARPHLPTLARIGCTTWGQLRALPRGGVVRRFGAELLDALDRAYGTKPELYPWLELPEVFEAKLELTARIDNAPALMFGARRLLAQLQVWLLLRQRGILALELGWELDARRQDASTGHLVLRTAEPTLDMGHVQRLLAEHLARVTLHAPALYLRLRSLETAALPGITSSLLPDDVRQGDSLHHLLERLSARLGADHVLCTVPFADHRPERMQVWQAASPMSSAAAMAAVPPPASTSAFFTKNTKKIANYSYLTRAIGKNDAQKRQKPGTRPITRADALYPTWLLTQPLKLAVRDNAPQCAQGGPLALLAGPQRVEAGWWSVQKSDASPSAPCALRDYFLARSEQMGLVWIYRERLGGRGKAGQSVQSRADSGTGQNAEWYLHGLFA